MTGRRKIELFLHVISSLSCSRTPNLTSLLVLVNWGGLFLQLFMNVYTRFGADIEA